jgi:hypothetical protein
MFIVQHNLKCYIIFLLFDSLIYSNLFNMKMALVGMHNMKHMGWARDKSLTYSILFKTLQLLCGICSCGTNAQKQWHTMIPVAKR